MEKLEVLNQHLYYDYDNNTLRWKSKRGCRSANSEAGYEQGRGYWCVRVCGKILQYHRVVWILHNQRDIPEGKEVDHIDGITYHNWPDNLRLSNESQNCWNQKLRKDNESGVKGVGLDKRRGTYTARVAAHKVVHRITGIKTLEEAKKVVEELREKLHKEFSNHGNHSE